ncbi:stage II sporulation protein R [Neobacillus terrae]|uniref:stage II sporulation protein R n=1 Tax=Neobacillus terrae TaxID=3034837 RepID=UPI0014079B87|nr:stage II sporulation protein R [Neobacillus terrae]NHM30105.1 stage II sporulation protein R [Neobacillus terrae]
MRSRTMVWAYLLILSIGTILSLYIPKNEAVQAKEEIVIPGEAIRLRILANSDMESDQALKHLVRDKVNENITLWVKDLTSIDEARTLIRSKLPEIQKIAENVVEEQKSDQKVKVNFGKVQFPTKLYGEFLYPAGEYEAILITLGEGKGANWWCVLYPPLCFLDFSSGTAVSAGFSDKKSDNDKEAKVNEDTKEVKEESNTGTELNEELKHEAEVKEETVKTEIQQSVNKEKEESKTIVKAEPVKIEQKEEAATEKAIEPNANVEEVKHDKSEQEELHEVKKASVYTADDEKPVEVKFFVVELWERIFN